MDYQIAHLIEGRIRLRIPLLAADATFASKLQTQVESIAHITSVRINPAAQSIVVTYKPKFRSSEAILAALQQTIEQVAPLPESTESVEPTAPTLSPSTSKPEAKQPAEPTPTDSPINSPINSPIDSPQYESSHESKTDLKHKLEKQENKPDHPPDNAPNHPPEPVLESIVTIDLNEDPWEASTAKASPAGVDSEQAVEPDLSANLPCSPSPDGDPSLNGSANSAPDLALTNDYQTNDYQNQPIAQPSPQTDIMPPMPLSTSQLAERLGVTFQSVTQKRSKPTFAAWSQMKDPEGLAWIYDLKSKSFHTAPLPSESSPQR